MNCVYYCTVILLISDKVPYGYDVARSDLIRYQRTVNDADTVLHPMDFKFFNEILNLV